MAEDMRSARTKRHLMAAFGEAIRVKPLKQITVKSLAEAAEVSKQAFYLHYADVYDIAEKWVAEQIGQMVDGMDFVADFFSDQQAFVRRLFATMHENQEFGAVLFRNDFQQMFLPCFIDRLTARIVDIQPGQADSFHVSVAATIILGGVLAIPPRYEENIEEAIEVAGEVLARMASGMALHDSLSGMASHDSPATRE